MNFIQLRHFFLSSIGLLVARSDAAIIFSGQARLSRLCSHTRFDDGSQFVFLFQRSSFTHLIRLAMPERVVYDPLAIFIRLSIAFISIA